MAKETVALTHIQHIIRTLERVERKQDELAEDLERGIADVRGLAQGAHAKVDALVNKGQGFRLGTAFGLSLGGGGLGAAIVKWWPFA